MTDTAAQPAAVANAAPDTMAWDSGLRRMMMIYLPLGCFVLILLFPFYWMAITSFKPNAELMNYKDHNPFWISSPTLAHIKHLLFDTAYPRWLKTTMLVAIGSTTLSLIASTLAAYAIERLRFRGSPMSASASTSPISCRRRSCSFRSPPSWCSSACSTAQWR
jgi:multiple sugar transport system permease protein